MFIANPLEDTINSVEWIFPLTEIFHIVGFALSIGTIALVDFRLLGLGMRHQTAAQIESDTAPWTLAGLVVMLFSGPILFLSDVPHYLGNTSFRVKITCLLLAILFNYTIHHRVVSSNPSPALSKLVGGISLALWVSVVAGGLFIAF